MSSVDTLISLGLSEVGKPYVYGDEGPNTFDCSGLMQWIFGKVAIQLPRTAREQQQYAKPVDTPRPGDLVFWGSPAHHVALYLGDGRILSAPKPGAYVHVTTLYGNPTYGRVPGLASGVGSVVTPIVAGAGGIVSGVADQVGKIGLIILIGAGGALMVGLGAWQLSKGGKA